MKNKNAFIFLPWVIGIAVMSVGALTVNYFKVLNQTKKTMAPVSVSVASLPDEASVYLETESQNFKVAKRQLVKLIVDTTKSNRKVDFLETKVCWDKENFKIINKEKDILIGQDDSFSDIVMTKIIDENQSTCAMVYVKSERTSSELKSGKLEAINFYLTGNKVGQGSIIVDEDATKMSGPPVEGKRYKIGIGEMGEFSYSVSP